MATYVIAKKCPFGQCGKVTEATVDAAAYDRWKAGAFIQDAFPDLTNDQREFLMSGFCPDHMAVVFAPPPD